MELIFCMLVQVDADVKVIENLWDGGHAQKMSLASLVKQL